MTPEQFKQERKYLKNVTPKTLAWYDHSFKAFDGALGGKAPITARITEFRQRGISPISINTRLRCINAHRRWLHVEQGHDLIKIPKLKEEQKVLATFSAEQVKALLGIKPKGKNAARAGAWKKYTSDAFGRLLTVEEPNPAGGSYFTYYTYDLLDHLIGVSMARPTGTQTRSFNYIDPATSKPGVLLRSATNPENGTVTNTYDSSNRQEGHRDARFQCSVAFSKLDRR